MRNLKDLIWLFFMWDAKQLAENNNRPAPGESLESAKRKFYVSERGRLLQA